MFSAQFSVMIGNEKFSTGDLEKISTPRSSAFLPLTAKGVGLFSSQPARTNIDELSDERSWPQQFGSARVARRTDGVESVDELLLVIDPDVPLRHRLRVRRAFVERRQRVRRVLRPSAQFLSASKRQTTSLTGNYS